MTLLLTLAGIFASLSLVAFGGGNTVLPEMQRQMVQVHHWMSEAEFNALFGLSRAAPGPNLMVVTVLGWRVAGAAGALTATLATFAPPTLLTLGALQLWDRHRDASFRRAIQRGLAPVTAGLVAASALLIARSAATGMATAGIVAGTALLAGTTKLHPVWLIAIGAGAAAALT